MTKYIMTQQAYNCIKMGGRKDPAQWLDGYEMIEYINKSFGLIHHIDSIVLV